MSKASKNKTRTSSSNNYSLVKLVHAETPLYNSPIQRKVEINQEGVITLIVLCMCRSQPGSKEE